MIPTMASSEQAVIDLIRHARRLGHGDVSVFPAGWAQPRDAGDSERSAVDAAMDLCRSVLQGDSDGPRLIMELAQKLLEGQRPDIAALVLDELLDTDSHVRGAAALWAECCRRTGRVEAALDGLALAAAERPKRPGPARRLAQLLLDLDRRQQAVPWLRRWALLEPDTTEPRDLLHRILASRRPPPPDLPADERLLDALYRVPVLAAQDFTKLRCTALVEGNTNAVYRLDGAAGSLVLRLGKYPRQRWNTFWEERINLGLAHARGLAPAFYFMDCADGTLVMPFIQGQRGNRMDNSQFLARAGAFFRRLHQGPAFQGRYTPLEALDWREDRVGGVVPAWAPKLNTLRQDISMLRQALAASFPGWAPCHNDPVIGNFIDTAEGLLMIDWQTAAMADADAEIGAFLARINRDGDLRAHFLASVYDDPDGPRAHRARLWEILARYIEVIEAVQMGVDAPDDTGWQTHGAEALAAIAALTEDGTLARGLTALGYST